MATERMTPFGEVLERRRLAAGLSKQGLATRLGISRVTYWRVTHGVAELTDEQLRTLDRVAPDPDAAAGEAGQWEPEPDEAAGPDGGGATTRAGQELEDFASNMDRLVRTLSSRDGEPLDIRSKIAILNGFEEAARLTGNRIPDEYLAVRRRVLSGEL